MHVVTFYSYKGGVGRTMALLNAAVLLAKAGKRVLLVDFDLEAPGLTSFDMLACARTHIGVVDYVNKYRQTLESPDVTDYIVNCDTANVPLWVMPAGDHTQAGYSDRLNSIDWERLYREEEGFLFFEDLKSQWAGYDATGFDYVLIDSRTGHTDVGGICTRQLPDAVVVMFLPNEQNIQGLVPIVDGIRSEERARAGEVAIHFCPANVPDEFDEDEVLERMLNRAAEELGYSERKGIDQPAAVIRHWSSLEILMQPALALARPKSRLASEYGQLTKAIESTNLADEDGALEALSRAKKEHRILQRTGRGGDLTKLTRRGQEIRRLHPKSGRIALSAAGLFNLLTEPRLEVAALTDAIELKERTNTAFLSRAVALHSLRKPDAATSDLVAVLKSQEATKLELLPAFRLLSLIDEEWLQTAQAVYRDAGLTFRAKAILAEAVMTRREQLPIVIADMQRLSVDPVLTDQQRQDAAMLLQLAQIGHREFADVVARYDQPQVENSGDAAEAFNLGMAVWGLEGHPPLRLFARVVESLGAGEDQGANVHQCLALAFALLGRRSLAMEQLDLAEAGLGAETLEFSCWTFLYSTAERFSADIDAMRDAIQREASLAPPFLGELAITGGPSQARMSIVPKRGHKAPAAEKDA